MTDEVLAAQEADDANLLNLVRAGDSGAFAVLRQRHEQAARRLARELVGSAAFADDLVEQTFARVLDVTSHGGGPTDAFRPYLLTALRLACDNDGLAAEGTDTPETTSLMATAFFALPERWIAVLWHTEIESASAADVAPLLGLTPEGVAALRRHAREGLRQTYLQLYASRLARPECEPIAEQLGAFVRDPAPGPEGAMVTEHLSQCDDCRARYADLADVNMALRTLVAPVILGGAAAGYLAGTPHETAAASTAAATGTATMAAIDDDPAGLESGHMPWLSAPLRRRSLQPLRLLAAAAVIVVCGAGFAVSLVSRDTPLGAAHRPQAGAGGTPAPVVAVSPSPSQPTSAASPGTRKPGRKHAGSHASATPPASVVPVAATSPPSAALTAGISLDGQHGRGHWHGAQVVFQVSNTGSATTRKVTVSITLPPGTWVFGGPPGQGGGHGPGGGGHGGWPGHGGGHWHATGTAAAGTADAGTADAGNGWSCQPTSTGATCQHSAISPGGQAQGMLYIAFFGSSACGQSVGLTASSGSASASAQSPQDLRC
ncbi:MAG TPA: zf-HC2 domain-containing protein [Streptosporangiaceae bacterium]|nr:zf-HC2 domain-containing protein [Streptosporangiaceae bacterium]